MDNEQNNNKPGWKNPWKDIDWVKYRRTFGDWQQRTWKSVQKIYSKLPAIYAKLRKLVAKLKIEEDFQKAFQHLRLRNIALLVSMVLLIIYIVSGFYMVNPGEVAVERMFGSVVKEGILEGLHYRLPWPFQQVDKVNVAEIQREGIGTLLPEHRGVHSSPDKIQILTGDENIVDVQLVIQYRITDPAKYLFKVDYSPYQIINEVVRYAVTKIGNSMLVDEILTIAKEAIQRMVLSEAQRLLDNYESGLSVITVNINKMYPPNEVADAFRDVASAREDRSRIINNAEGYRNSLIPPAKGDAERMIREAEGYKEEVINRAQGETQRFLQMLAEYQKAGGNVSPDVTRKRLYLETMEKILPRVTMYITNSDGSGKMNLRFFEGNKGNK